MISNITKVIKNFGAAISSANTLKKNTTKTVDDKINNNYSTNSYNVNSIKSKAKDLILQYPILCSESISIDKMNLVSDAFEQEYVYLVALLIKNTAVNYSNSGNAKAGDFLKQYHQNISKIYLLESNERQLKTLEEKINMNSLNDLSLPKYFKEDNVSTLGGGIIKYPGRSNTKEKATGRFYIDDKDIKKYNAITPTYVKTSIKWRIYDNNKDSKANIVEQDIQFGVKSVVHKLGTKDIVDNIGLSLKNSNALFTFLRWTSGEIKLFKDILLDLDNNKKMAKDVSKKGSTNNNYWWYKLREMSSENNVSRFSKSNMKGLIPTATLVLSKMDVDNIKNVHGIDILNNPEHSYKICKNLFLLSFAIVDESADMFYLFDDMTKSFAIYPCSSIKPKYGDKSVNKSIEDIVSLFKR